MPRRLDLTPYGLWPMAYGRWLMAYASCDIAVSVATRVAESQDEGHAGATDRLALVNPPHPARRRHHEAECLKI